MKRIRHLFFLLTILIPSVAAATPTQYGDSGLVSVPTADVTERGIYNAAVWLNNSQNNGNKAARFPISLAMGIGFGWEFFGSHPGSNQEDGSMSNFGGAGIKFRLTGGLDSNLRTSGTLFIRQTVSEDEALTGLRDLGAKLIMSYSLANAGVHLNVGYLKVDSPETMKYDNEVLFGGAIEVPISKKMNSFLELDGNTGRNGGSSRIELSPGVQYYILPSIAMAGGVGFGLTDAGPDYRVVAGLTFTSGAGKYTKVIPVIPGSRERYAAMAAGSIEELIPDLPMETTEGIATEIKAASAPEGAPGGMGGVPSLEALEAFQAPSPVSQAPLLKPGGKDMLTPGGLIGSAEVEAVSMEPPMPIILTTSVEKAAMENIPLAPEIPAEVSTEVFVPPLPVSEEKVEIIEAGKEKAEVHQEVTEAAGEGQTRTKRYYAIWYEFRSSEITPFAKGILDRVGVENKGSGERFTVEIAGHTDSIGSAETNKKLSQKRAESAKDYLVIKHGFDPDIFAVNGYGEEMPDASNDTPEGRGKNRRVEITVYSGLKRAELAATLIPPTAVTEGTYRRPEIPAEIPLVALAPPLPGAVISAVSSQLPERQLKTGKRILYREILFLAEKPDPSPIVKGILDKMAEGIKKSGKRFVVIIDGHADSKETAASLTELSYNRANGVKDYLVQKHGFDPNSFVLKGYGKERSVASSDTPEGRGRNRRAEISVYSAAEGSEAANVLSPIPATPAPVEAPPAPIELPKPVSEETSAPKEDTSLKPEIPAAAPPTIAAPSLPVSEVAPKQGEQLVAGKKLLYYEVLFLAGSPDPSPFVQGILDKMAEQTKKKGKRFVVKIEGHTDSQESTNLTELSYSRVNSVKDYLVKKHGFDEKTFVIKGYGSEKPIAPNNAPEGMKKNRRVEITVFEAKD